MPENRHSVVVASRRCCLGINSRPFLAISLRDLADLGVVQTRPSFLERGKTLSPVIPRAWFDAQIVVEISKMNGDCFAPIYTVVACENPTWIISGIISGIVPSGLTDIGPGGIGNSGASAPIGIINIPC